MDTFSQTAPNQEDRSLQQGRDQLELARWLTSLAGQPIELLKRLAQDPASLKGQAAQLILQERL